MINNINDQDEHKKKKYLLIPVIIAALIVVGLVITFAVGTFSNHLITDEEITAVDASMEEDLEETLEEDSTINEDTISEEQNFPGIKADKEDPMPEKNVPKVNAPDSEKSGKAADSSESVKMQTNGTKDEKQLSKTTEKPAVSQAPEKTSKSEKSASAQQNKQTEEKKTEMQKEEKQEEPKPAEKTAKLYENEIVDQNEQGHWDGWYVCNQCGETFNDDDAMCNHFDNTGHGSWHTEEEWIVDVPQKNTWNMNAISAVMWIHPRSANVLDAVLQ